jgi:hypothetical protein
VATLLLRPALLLLRSAAESVVVGALVRIGEEPVRVADLLKATLGRRLAVIVLVGVPFKRLPAICLGSKGGDGCGALPECTTPRNTAPLAIAYRLWREEAKLAGSSAEWVSTAAAQAAREMAVGDESAGRQWGASLHVLSRSAGGTTPF